MIIDRKFVKIAARIGVLVAKKNIAYGDSFGRAGEILSILYPNGVQPNQYKDVLGVIRVIDKLFRIANDKMAFDESPWEDIVGYGILGAASQPTAGPPPVEECDGTVLNSRGRSI